MSLPVLLLLTLMADGGTGLTLSPAESPEAEPHRHRVEIARTGGFAVTPLGANAPCAAAPDADPAICCSRSSRQLLADG